MEDLSTSLKQYEEQLELVNQALKSATNEERGSLVTLHSDLQQLIQLTQENLDSIKTNHGTEVKNASEEIDDEYALFMEEMAKSGAYEPESSDKQEESGFSKENAKKKNEDSDIEDELASLLGMKCAVYHTHKWGGQPTLHNAMVSSVVPREDADQFNDLQVRILFTHPTHTEMLPCPFFLDGECRFNDEQCRYSHGTIVPLSQLNEAIEPSFEAIKLGSRILMKLKPPDDEDISLTKKSTEKYHLWHRAIITSVELEKRVCSVKLEHGVKSGDKRKGTAEEYNVCIEDIFPLNTENQEDSSSDGSLSDTDYPDNKCMRTEHENEKNTLIAEHLPRSGPAMGEWERHTRGIGSKLMFAMGYVPGSGLGAAGDGIVAPVEARVLPVGKSLDQCMAISERNQERDPMKVDQRLKRLQKKEEDRNKRAYERAKEKEKRNVFNFINRTLGDTDEIPSAASSINVKESTSKDLNIEQFKITEDLNKLEKEVIKLNISLGKYPTGTPGYRSIAVQIAEKNKELDTLKRREQQITREQKQRKDKAKMTVF